MTFFNFTYKIMAYLYKLIFDTTFPSLIEGMKVVLQNPNEPLGD